MKATYLIINNSINLINEILKIIEAKKALFTKNPKLRDNIYTKNEDFLAYSDINKITSLITGLKQLISVFEEDISKEEDNELLQEVIKNKENLDSDIDDGLETLYIEELLSMYNGLDKNRVTSTIRHLYGRVDGIIGSDMTIGEKKKAFKNPLTALDPSYLENNQEAISLLKILVEIKIEKAFKAKDKFSMVFTIPKKYQEQTYKQLKKIVEQFVENNGNKKYIKKKCEDFIEKLDGVIPNLLRSIEEKQNIAKFKFDYIIPILLELKIPRIFYNDFMVIVDIYHKEKRESLIELARREIHHINKLNISYLILKETVANYPPFVLDECEKCIISIQNNLPGKIAIDIAIEKEEQRAARDDLDKNNLTDVIKRIHGFSLTRDQRIKPANPILEKLEINIEKQNQGISTRQPSVLQKNKTNNITLEQELLEKTTNHFLQQYPNIPELIKVKLKLFVDSYYLYIKSIMTENQLIVNKIFSDIRRKT
ncbi:MAG: hypothetical protein QM490_02965 [Candidatus Gracilibacteria bacterium]